MAEEQYRRNCQVFDTTGAESQKYAQEILKQGDQTGTLEGNSTVDASNYLDTTDALGGGSCPADVSVPISVMGRSWTFSMAVSRVCQGASMFGFALVAACAVVCALIVFKD